MRRIFAIAGLNLLSLSRDRGELIGATVLPLLLTWVFSTAFGAGGAERPVQLPVADADKSAYSAAMVKAIDAAPAFEVKPVSEKVARAKVKEGDAPAAVIIDRGFGRALESSQTARMEVLRYPGAVNAYAAAAVIEGAVKRVSANAEAARTTAELLGMTARPASNAGPDPSFGKLYEKADGFWEPEPVAVVSSVAQLDESGGASGEVPSNIQYSLGFTVFFVFMTAMGSAGGVLEERELGTLRRLLASPLRRADVLGGKILGIALVAGAQAALLVGVGAVAFGVPWGQDPVAVSVLLISLVLAATGLGVMISALVRTRSQMSALVPIVSTALAMLGGCYWPLEVTSPTMQKIGMFTPTGWAMAGFKDVVARGAGTSDVAVPVAVLIGFAAACIAVGTTRLELE